MSMKGKKGKKKKKMNAENKFNKMNTGNQRKTPIDISGSGNNFSASQSGAYNEEGVDVSKSLTSLADMPPLQQKKVAAFDANDFDDWDLDDANDAPSPPAKVNPVSKKALPSLKAKEKTAWQPPNPSINKNQSFG